LLVLTTHEARKVLALGGVDMRTTRFAIASAGVALFVASSALAHEDGTSAATGADFEQLLGNQVPSAAVFREADGRKLSLDDLFGEKPLMLVPAYYRCPNLCPLTLKSLARSVGDLDLQPGEDFEVVVLGIDPREDPSDAAATQKELISGESDARAQLWHFLTGEEDQIREVADSIGFHYVYDESKDEYAHASGLVLLTPSGRVARYLPGIEFPPRDLKFGLIEAADGEIGSLADRLFLLCYGYDPETGKYTVTILSALRVAGVATVVALGGFVGLAFIRERRRARDRG
jgi:protein SCO1/2